MIRMGSWIGGDRDGNPYVTEEVVGFSTTMAARTAIGHYLEQLEVLGMEMSLSTRLTVPFDALYALTGTSPEDPSADEPCRIALRHPFPIGGQSHRDVRRGRDAHVGPVPGGRLGTV